MFSYRPIPHGDTAKNFDLVSLLGLATSSMGLLMELTRNIAGMEESVSLGFCPRQMKHLCRTIEKGRAAIEARITGISRTGAATGEPAADSNPPFGLDSPAAFMVEYRRCCRRLCRALGEARKASDASTVAMLSEIILKLEKQLWLIDKPRHDPGTERYRSVSLFLTC